MLKYALIENKIPINEDAIRIINSFLDNNSILLMQIIKNIKDVINNITKFSVDNLKGFSKEIEPTVTDVLNVWSNVFLYCPSPFAILYSPSIR